MEMTENEKYFINYSQNIPSKKGLFIIWMSLIIISIPAAFLGAYSNITKIILLPITAGMSLYIIYLAYKFAATAMNVPLLTRGRSGL